MEISCCYFVVAAKETRASTLSIFLPFRKLGHLKLHTVGDENLSHSLGIDFGCAGHESDYDNNADRWYD
jgi:hypothetical protein